MPSNKEFQTQPQQYYQDPVLKITEIEEKLRLLKDRVLLIGQTHIEEREKSFNEIQELKKTTFEITQENNRIKDLLQRITELLNNTARKEELNILQRQFDLFRE